MSTTTSKRDHIVEVPFFFLWLRIAQVVFTLAVLIVGAYGLSVNDWVLAGNCYAVFVAIITFVILAYYLLATLCFPRAYNRWAVLVLECFANVWWLAAFANLAAIAATWSGAYVGWDGWVYTSSDSRLKVAMAAGAGLGAVNWILFVVTLVLYGLALHKHRRSGAPSRAGKEWTEARVGTKQDNVEAVAMTGPNAPSTAYQPQWGNQQEQQPMMH